jgi:anti-anti-sigma factor
MRIQLSFLIRATLRAESTSTVPLGRPQHANRLKLGDVRCILGASEGHPSAFAKRYQMSEFELVRINSEGTSRMVSFSSEHINRMETARQISWQLSELIGEDKSQDGRQEVLNLDFKEIDWISSAGLNELIGINSQARSQGVRIVLVDVQQSVRDVFALTRLERMFEFSSSTVQV